jgi:hypothetical protein
LTPETSASPSGPDGKGQAKGQARNARGEPPHPESRGKSVILTEVQARGKRILSGTGASGESRIRRDSDKGGMPE